MDAIQLYTLRELDVPITELLERVADAGFDGVEYAYRIPDADPNDVRETLVETGLDVPSAHVHISELEDDLDSTAERYRDLRCERLVIPYLADEHFESREAVEVAADRLDELAERAAEHDFPLLYHNHAAEFTDLNDETAFDVLLAETDHVNFELDVGLARSGGADPVAVLDRHGDRIELLHCTDVDLDTPPGPHVSVGTGDVDYGPVFDAATDAGVEWYVYENGSTDTPEGELDHAVRRFLGR